MEIESHLFNFVFVTFELQMKFSCGWKVNSLKFHLVFLFFYFFMKFDMLKVKPSSSLLELWLLFCIIYK